MRLTGSAPRAASGLIPLLAHIFVPSKDRNVISREAEEMIQRTLRGCDDLGSDSCQGSAAYEGARIAALRGENDLALTRLERAVRHGDGSVSHRALAETDLKNLRQSLRFHDLLAAEALHTGVD